MTTLRTVQGSVSRPSDPVSDLIVEVWMTWGQRPVDWSTISNTQVKFLGRARTDADGKFNLSIPVDDPRVVSTLRQSRCLGDQLQIRVFHKDLELSTSGSDPVVWSTDDEPYTVKVSVADGASTNDRVVTGVFYRKDRSVRAGASALLKYLVLGGADTLKATVTTGNDGRYTITYSHTGTDPDLYVRFEQSSARIATSKIVYCAPDFVRMDVQIPDAVERGSSEWDMLHASLDPLLTTASLGEKDVTADEVQYLAEKTHFSSLKVTRYCAAYRLVDFVVPTYTSSLSHLNAEAFYGLLAQGLPLPFFDLASQSSETLLAALQKSQSTNVAFGSGIATDAVDELKALVQEITAEKTDLEGSLASILEVTDLNSSGTSAFSTFYAKWRTRTSLSAFWADVESTWTNAVMVDVRKKLRLASLTARHAKLVAGVDQVHSGWASVEELAQLTTAEWDTVLGTTISSGPHATKVVGRPAAFATDADYRDFIYSQLELSSPKSRLMKDISTEPAYADPSSVIQLNAFDFDTTRVNDAWWTAADKSGISGDPDQARSTLQQLQRLHRFVPAGTGRLSTIKTLQTGGYGAAIDIHKTGRRAFLADVGGTLGDSEASQIYAAAEHQIAKAATLYSINGADLAGVPVAAVPNVASAVEDGADVSDVADYTSLFGSLNQCICDPCLSILGPAAYLVDVIGYLDDIGLKSEFMDPSTGRRPEVGVLKATCANADRPLPTIDLVNEVLENAIGGSGSKWLIARAPYEDSTSPPSQTTLSETELRSIPEYRNENAYSSASGLAGFNYPMTLPFELGLTGTRVYLAHLGVPRFQLLESLPTETGGLASEAQRAAEQLGSSTLGWEILTGTESAAPDDWTYWGFSAAGTWVADLGSAATYVSRARASYEELLDLLELPAWAGTTTATELDSTGYVACDVSTWNLTNLSVSRLMDQMRFLRLWRGTGWSPLSVQRAFDALSLSGFGEPTAKAVGRLLRLEQETGLSPEELLCWFGDLDTRSGRTKAGETEPSYYERLFQDPSLGTVALAALALDSTSSPPTELDDTTYEIGGVDPTTLPGQPAFTNALQAALKVSYEELEYLHNMILGGSPGSRVNATLARLSVLARHASLARVSGRTIEDSVRHILRSGFSPFDDSDVAEALGFLGEAEWLRERGPTWSELLWLLEEDPEASSEVGPQTSALVATLSSLSADLALLESEAVDAAAISALAEAIGLEDAVAAVFLQSTSPNLSTGSESTALGEFTSSAFLALEGAITDPSDAQAAHDTLMRLHKLAWSSTFLDMDIELATWWLSNYTTWSFLDPASLPVSAAASAETARFQALVRMFRVVDEIAALPNVDGSTTYDLLNSVDQSTITTDILSRTGWASDQFDRLNGANGFNHTSPDDWWSHQTWRQYRDAFGVIQTTGLGAEQLGAYCVDSPTTASMDELRLAVRSRYETDQWDGVVVPLQDQLRQAQRDALVDYHMHSKGVGEPSGLFAYFLMDPMVEPCASNSRIRFTLNAAQTLVQRALLNLEGAHGPTLSRELSRRWEWMKNYRVWEAGMKVFLWPENWIDPGLRSDRTPLFETAQDRLAQAEFKNADAEDVYAEYLGGLQEVSALYPLAVLRDQVSDADGEQNDFYVFARTRQQPFQYFWRKQVDDGAWTPWERLDVGITGSILIPVVHNRRLRLVWPNFTKKSYITKSGEDSENVYYYEIHLSTSTFWRGEWTPKQDATSKLATLAVQRDGKYVLPHWARFSFRSEIDDKGALIVRAYLRSDGYNTADDSAAYAFDDNDVDSSLEPYDYFAVGAWKYSSCEGGFSLVEESDPPSLEGIPGKASTYGNLIWKRTSGDGLLTVPTLMGGEVQLLDVNSAPRKSWVLAVDTTQASFRADSEVSVFFNSDRSFIVRPTGPRAGTESDSDFGLSCFVKEATDSSPDVSPVDVDIDYGGNSASPPPVSGGSLGGSYGMDEEVGFAGSTELSSSAGGSAMMANTSGLSALYADRAGGQSELDDINYSLAQASSAVGNPQSDLTDYSHFSFEVFYHPWSCVFVSELARLGVDGLLFPDSEGVHGGDLSRQAGSEAWFAAQYSAAEYVQIPLPEDDISFAFGSAYGVYNWELFFHLPMLIAQQLSQNLQYADARRWLHAIFDPTDQDGGTSDPNRYWKTQPLSVDPAAPVSSAVTLLSAKSDEADAAERTQLERQIEAWRKDPFDPYAIASLRLSAYQKATVMKYLDNLLDWADDLFRQYTMESVNEAVQLYILAGDILGDRPVLVADQSNPTPSSVTTLLDGEYSTFATLESDAVSSANSGHSPSTGPATNLAVLRLLGTFCAPPNPKLLGYWDAVDDRLYKIRNCLTIDGVFKPLALYQAPLDPSALVKAAAAGGSLSQLSMSSSRPAYRFGTMIQRAYALAGSVRSLGQSLLSALEKRDAEALAMLRSGHERSLLDAIRAVKSQAVDDAQKQVEIVAKRGEMAQGRWDYYNALIDGGLLEDETKQQKLLNSTIPISASMGGLQALAGILALTPMAKFGYNGLGGELTAGFGGQPLAATLGYTAGAAGNASSILSTLASLSGMAASNTRRQRDWDQQKTQAQMDLDTLALEAEVAELRLETARRDLAAHDRQVAHAEEVGEFLESKFSSERLYDWMVKQITSFYFQAYQLALSTAKKAEACYFNELGVDSSNVSFISGQHYDSLRKGLLAGERLQFELERLETAHMDGNSRRFELTKTISLARLDPDQLAALRNSGTSTFAIPEWLFDLDYPGHYQRRIKSVAVSIPCISDGTAPVAATLTLNSSSVRKSAATTDADLNSSTPSAETVGQATAIALSRSQRDSGVFQLNMQDPRYLPFEGAGAISNWTLAFTEAVAQFDRQSISDVEIHLSFTALDGGTGASDAASNRLLGGGSVFTTGLLEDASAPVLYQLVSAKADHADAFAEMLATASGTPSLSLELDSSTLPYAFRALGPKIRKVTVMAVPTNTDESSRFQSKTFTFMDSASTTVATSSTDTTSYPTGAVDSLSLDPEDFDSLELALTTVPADLDYLDDILIVLDYYIA